MDRVNIEMALVALVAFALVREMMWWRRISRVRHTLARLRRERDEMRERYWLGTGV